MKKYKLRGLKGFDFTDYYDNACSIQESSLADESAIWLGFNEASIKILARDAVRLGIRTDGAVTGWVKYELPEEVSVRTRMHLTVDQVKDLLPLLQYFAEHGELPNSSGQEQIDET